MSFFPKCAKCHEKLSWSHWNNISFEGISYKFCDTCYIKIINDIFNVKIKHFNWIYQTELYQNFRKFLEGDKKCKATN